MKRICKLCFALVFLFALVYGGVLRVKAQSDMEGIEDFKVEVVPNLLGKTTNVTISWTTLEELTEAAFIVRFDIDGQKTETPFDYGKKHNSNCLINEINIKKDNIYYHKVSFNILSGKVGTARLDFTYQISGNNYKSSLYIKYSFLPVFFADITKMSLSLSMKYLKYLSFLFFITTILPRNHTPSSRGF